MGGGEDRSPLVPLTTALSGFWSHGSKRWRFPGIPSWNSAMAGVRVAEDATPRPPAVAVADTR